MADYPPVEHRARMRWRQGAGRGVTGNIYAQADDRPSPDDELVCVADTAMLAVHIVAAHNAMLGLRGPLQSKLSGD